MEENLEEENIMLCKISVYQGIVKEIFDFIGLEVLIDFDGFDVNFDCYWVDVEFYYIEEELCIVEKSSVYEVMIKEIVEFIFLLYFDVYDVLLVELLNEVYVFKFDFKLIMEFVVWKMIEVYICMLSKYMVDMLINIDNEDFKN